MSKLNVKGSASVEYPTDVFRISAAIKAQSQTSGEAIAEGKRNVEQFLQKMNTQLGIAPENFVLESEGTERGYQENAPYRYTKRIAIQLAADLSEIEKITQILEELTDVEYHMEAKLSDSAAKEQLVMQAALDDSRRKAEQLAAMLGEKITGAEKVNFEFSEEAATEKFARCMNGAFADSMAAKLQNPRQTISKYVEVTWLAE